MKPCEHNVVLLANQSGKDIPSDRRNVQEVDFLIVCADCEEELFRISEYKREIINLSKH